MSDYDRMGKHGRALEEEYFAKRDREIIEKIRQANAAEELRKDVGRKVGLDAPEFLALLAELGFTPETTSLLPLVPIVQMAWVEGGVSKAERDLIVRLARSRGVEEGSAADRQLTDWLTDQPSETTFSGARRLIRAIVDSGSVPPDGMTPDDMVKYCEEIASASGGFLGIGRISAEERALLSSIATDVHARRT